jgi:hypothetical protein
MKWKKGLFASGIFCLLWALHWDSLSQGMVFCDHSESMSSHLPCLQANQTEVGEKEWRTVEDF